MNELMTYTIVLAVWFLLQLVILPKLGIPTCMSGACRVPAPKKPKQETKDLQIDHRETDADAGEAP